MFTQKKGDELTELKFTGIGKIHIPGITHGLEEYNGKSRSFEVAAMDEKDAESRGKIETLRKLRVPTNLKSALVGFVTIHNLKPAPAKPKPLLSWKKRHGFQETRDGRFRIESVGEGKAATYFLVDGKLGRRTPGTRIFRLKVQAERIIRSEGKK